MEVGLKADPRDRAGKGVARTLRAQGRVPGILYGRGIAPVALSVEARALSSVLHTDAGRNVLIDLEVDGDNHLSMAREIQRHPVRGDYLHVDFIKIARDVAIEVSVPVGVVGESPGVAEGGVVEHHLWEVRVSCLPTDVPERLEADISAMAIGDALRVEGLVVPTGVTILTPREEIVLAVVVPQVLEIPEPVAAAGVEALVEGEEAAAGEAVPEGEGGPEEEETGEEG